MNKRTSLSLSKKTLKELNIIRIKNDFKSLEEMLKVFIKKYKYEKIK